MNLFRTKIVLLLLGIMIISIGISGQYDHKQVMMNQIRRLEARREFAQVLQIYEDLIERYSEDQEIVTGYFNTLLNLNRVEAAAQILEDYEDIFAPDVYTQMNISILIRKGETSQARKTGMDYLRDNPGNIAQYRNFALVYERERQSEIAIDVLKQARRTTGDDHIFAVELARNYEQINDYPEAIGEYINHLERNPGYLFFVTNRIKGILDEDEKGISTLENRLADSEEQILLELYALSLAHIGNLEDAFLVYQRLEPEKLFRFADELFVAGNIDLARQAYEKYRESITDPVKSAEVGIKIAQLHISKNQLRQAQEVLREITEDTRIQDRQVRFRTRANRQARELLADIAIRLDEPQDDVIIHFEEAKNFAFNRNEQKELDLKVAHYLVMSENYNQAGNLLESILRNEPSGSQINNLGHYYRFMLVLMEYGNPSDSLLTEMIIGMPGNELTGEALFLTVIFHEMKSQVRNTFLEAYRLKSIYKEDEALDRLLAIDKNTNDEEIIMISGLWAMEAGKYDIAEDIFSHPFQNETLLGYATLKLAELKKNKQQEYENMLTEFLTEYPTHIFSPKFRLLLTAKQPSTVRRPD